MRKVLVVESGSPGILDRVLDSLYAAGADVDVVTCYARAPRSFRPDKGTLHQIPAHGARFPWLRARAGAGYDAVGIICSGEPIMTRWKWALALRLRTRLFIINENGDYFWFDRSNWRIIRHFVAVRSGLSGAELVPALGRALLFPFTLLYLILWFVAAHVRRRVHI